MENNLEDSSLIVCNNVKIFDANLSSSFNSNLENSKDIKKNDQKKVNQNKNELYEKIVEENEDAIVKKNSSFEDFVPNVEKINLNNFIKNHSILSNLYFFLLLFLDFKTNEVLINNINEDNFSSPTGDSHQSKKIISGKSSKISFIEKNTLNKLFNDFKPNEKMIEKPIFLEKWSSINYPNLNQKLISNISVIEKNIPDGNSSFRAIIIEWLTFEILEKGINFIKNKFINDLIENKPLLIQCFSKIKLINEDNFKNNEPTRMILINFFRKITKKILKNQNNAKIRKSIIKNINKDSKLDISLIIFARSILICPCLYFEEIDFEKVHKIMGLEFRVFSINKQKSKLKNIFSIGENQKFSLIFNYDSNSYDILSEGEKLIQKKFDLKLKKCELCNYLTEIYENNKCLNCFLK